MKTVRRYTSDKLVFSTGKDPENALLQSYFLSTGSQPVCQY